MTKVNVENKARQLNRLSCETSGIFNFSSGYSFLFTLAISRRFFSALSALSYVRYQRLDSCVNLNPTKILKSQLVFHSTTEHDGRI